jgi:hypothetical protein
MSEDTARGSIQKALLGTDNVGRYVMVLLRSGARILGALAAPSGGLFAIVETPGITQHKELTMWIDPAEVVGFRFDS